MENALKMSLGYMVFAAALAIALGFAMLFYPGGTMAIMAAALWVLKFMVSIFILSYAVTEAVRFFRIGKKWSALGYLLVGIFATLFVWLFDIGVIYIIVSLFFIVVGINEIREGFSFAFGKYFFMFLGALNIMVGVIMLKYPVVLPLLIAWYVLFWGVSRLCLALEIKRMMHRAN